MKILQVIPRFNPTLGGGVNVVFNLSKLMARKGHEVTILTTKYKFDPLFAASLKKDGVEVIPIDYLFNFHLFIPSPKMKKWLIKNLKNFDIVHLNGARSYQNNILYHYACQFNIPYVLQTHGSILRIVEIKNLKRFYDIIWGYKLYKHASRVIALTQSESDACVLMGVNKNRVKIIPNGVDLDDFKNLPVRGEFRKKYSIADNEKVVLYLGRLHKSKGLDLLINSFSELVKDIPNVKLLLVGPDDGYGNQLNSLTSRLNIQNKVVMTGLVSELEKKMAFIDSDVFVTPRFYGFPITFAESCACGLPIITTNEGDKLDWINCNVGFVTKYDKHELKDGIKRIVSDDEIMKHYSKNAKLIINNKLNWIEISRNLEYMYLDILSSKQ